MGGLNIGSLVNFNLALVLKWKWRFFTSEGSLWVRVTRLMYGDDGGFFKSKRSALGSSPWAWILAAEAKLREKEVSKEDVLEKQVGNGMSTRFWKDVWVGKQSLASRFPRLFKWEGDPMGLVSEKWSVDGWQWTWSRPITDGIALGQVQSLCELLRDVRCSDELDDRVWSIDVEVLGDSAGNNFAFVKFANVEDKWKLEGDMQNVSCAGKSLAVNLARYARNKNHIHATAHQQVSTTKTVGPPEPRHTVYLPRPNTSNAYRSYADVTGALSARHATALQTLLLLTAGNAPKNWLKNNVLVGEVLSIDHMASLPSGFYGDDTVEKFRYIGGLNVAICFKNQLTAYEFFKDNGKWIEWFNWLVLGDNQDFCKDRIAWIKIMGLPMRLWSEDNVAAILQKFGKLIIPSDEMGTGADESFIKVGILTTFKRWINDEVAMAIGEHHFNVGLVEFERNWTPFTQCQFVDNTSSDEDEEDDEEAISDTDMVLEEGEIPAEKVEDSGDITGGVNSAYVQDSLGVPNLSGYSVPFKIANDESVADIQAPDTTHGEEPGSNLPVVGNSDLPMVGNSVDLTSIDVGPVGPTPTIFCFGPFTSNFPPKPTTLENNSQTQFLDDPVASGLGIKRMRVYRKDNWYSPYNRETRRTNKAGRSRETDVLPPSAVDLNLNSTPPLSPGIVDQIQRTAAPLRPRWRRQ
ncbi:hypothetical protein LXL04_038647 [Taraxacum kok-saghyz]